MKNLFAFFFIFLNYYIQLFAQDTIRTQDLPHSGDKFVLSTGIIFSGIQPAETGANYNWDYSNLESNNQRIDTMLNPGATNPALSFFFIDNILNTNRSNHASRGQDYNIGFTGLSDIYNYYYNSAAEYRQPGLGAVINSIPVPVYYIPHDVLYKFPLTYLDEDSVSYSYEVDLTSTIGIYYHVSRKRHNTVDGWGTLETPFGNFNVLRVHSVLIEVDSTFIKQLNIGIKSAPVTTHEFKWLGVGSGLPLLQINTTVDITTVTQILYQDSIRLTGISNALPIISDPLIFPNPASESIVIRYSLHNKSDVKFELVSMEGKQIVEVIKSSQPAGINFEVLDLHDYKLTEGNYIIKLQAGNSMITKELLIYKK